MALDNIDSEDFQTIIKSLATVRLHSKSRLLLTACCPDKDLVILLSRVGTFDKMSLWKVQGSKIWEVDLSNENGTSDEVTALNWSPNGHNIVVAHFPPRITLHSLENGREECSLPIEFPSTSQSSPPRITDLFWFKKERKTDTNQMPDMFKRGNVITGSALSILRTQPLLDPLLDDISPLNSVDLFAFQGTQTRQKAKASSLPRTIASWPCLPHDPLAASIKPSPRATNTSPGEELDEKDLTNVDSFLAAVDESGQIHCFLDGSYPLGAISLVPKCEAKTIMKNNEGSTLFVHAEISLPGTSARLNNLSPMTVDLPLLYSKATRQVADNCSAARELAWYAKRVVKDMRDAWFGGDGREGARNLNTSYIRGLDELLKHHNSTDSAVHELTLLLATGKPSPPLSIYLARCDLTSERGLQKWESTVGEALLNLRDYSEKRISPACQRLHLLLEELRGWSLLPQLYGKYEFSTEEIDQCIDLAARGIIISAWLAAAARQEYYRFLEFLQFLRHETARLSSQQTDAQIIPRHDILEVNEYLMSGLEVSSIDRWFMGPVPKFPPDSIAPPPTTELRSVLDRARKTLADPSELTWPPITETRDLSALDRNLDALVNELVEKCQQIYARAARAVAKTAYIDQTWATYEQSRESKDRLQTSKINPSLSRLTRTRVACDEKTGTPIMNIAILLQEGEHGLKECRELLCILRPSYEHEGNSRKASSVAFAILECKVRLETETEEDGVPEAVQEEDFHILDMDFFDDESLVIVYQKNGKEGPEMIGTVDYSGLEYSEMSLDKSSERLCVEDIVAEAITQVTAGETECGPTPIRKERALKLSPSQNSHQEHNGTAAQGQHPALAVNGRVGRRFVCVLDGSGHELEMFDMDSDEIEEEEEEDGE